ncbi:MAG: hypothetical protein QOJ34_2270 [Pseudonocardiales bacterium]|jgi:sterol desaturase/sphingolipid hydroxylase (fatty acid hydroxylase superfamily)|nr:hypothetical protein [Pseudonocardiales bacterium]
MTGVDEVAVAAQQQLAADEDRFTGPKRRSLSLRGALREFARHPSPWILLVTLVTTVTARVWIGDWQWTDAIVPAVIVAFFPFNEWLIHVGILHWKPRKIGRATIDSLLARKHREHHADPRDIPLIFIPWQTYFWLLPGLTAIALFVFPRPGLGLTYFVTEAALGLGYEWIHYLVHSDYRPKSKAYRAVWRNHRLHHYKNEHYWFTVTTSATADRVLGTYPDPETTRTSGTARALHATT